MNRAMELSEVQEGVKEAENAAKVSLTRISPIRECPIGEIRESYTNEKFLSA
jgi:hypothetical protein